MNLSKLVRGLETFFRAYPISLLSVVPSYAQALDFVKANYAQAQTAPVSAQTPNSTAKTDG